jgi:lipopolysaccharide biosynthesis regulator YciM
MTILILILILVAIIAIYPFIRDYVRRQKAPIATYTEGLCLLLDGKENEAIEKLKQAVAKDSNNVDAYLRLAELYSKKGETDRASKIFERLMLRRNLTSEQEKKVYQSLAGYYLKTDRLQRAITILEELVNLDANNAVHYESLLGLYCKTERWQDCEDLLKKLEKIQKDKEKLSEYYVEFGKKILARNPEESAKYFKQGLGFNRKSAEALIVLGDYYYNKREIDMAIKIWNELLEYYPNQSNLVRNRLEAAYYDLGQYEEIVNLYERLLKKAPDDIGLYFALAQIHAKKEEIDTAIKILNKIPVAKKKEALPQIALASLYLKHNDSNKARQVLDNLIEHLKQQV